MPSRPGQGLSCRRVRMCAARGRGEGHGSDQGVVCVIVGQHQQQLGCFASTGVVQGVCRQTLSGNSARSGEL
eukprot:48924-Eustigmatos_ZCMA.PRE.1